MIRDSVPAVGRWTTATALCVSVLVGCGGEAEDAGISVRDSAGVEIVENSGGDRPLGWRFRTVTRIGSARGQDVLFRVGRNHIDVGPDGRLYVLDGGTHRVLVYGPEGERIRSLGGEGSGPGEIGRPGALAVSSDGRLYVLDVVGPSLLEWTPDGRFVEERTVTIRVEDGLELRPDGDGLHVGPGGETIAGVRGGRDVTGDSILHAVARLGSAGDSGLVDGMWRPRPVMQEYGCVRIQLPPLFRPEISWHASDERTVFATGEHYEIRIFEGTDLIRVVRRSVPRVRTTEEMALAEVPTDFVVRFPGGECTVPPEELVEKRGFAPRLPAIDGVVLAPDGTLWVRRPTARDEASVDVFDPEGRYLGTVEGFGSLPADFLSPDTAVLVREDTLGVESVEVVELRRN